MFTTPWTYEEIETMHRMADEGYTRGEVAEAIGRTKDAVRSKSNSQGIKFRRQNRRKIQPPEPEKTRRECLMCGEEFDSEWIGERVCYVCKQSAEWRAGA